MQRRALKEEISDEVGVPEWAHDHGKRLTAERVTELDALGSDDSQYPRARRDPPHENRPLVDEHVIALCRVSLGKVVLGNCDDVSYTREGKVELGFNGPRCLSLGAVGAHDLRITVDACARGTALSDLTPEGAAPGPVEGIKKLSRLIKADFISFEFTTQRRDGSTATRHIDHHQAPSAVSTTARSRGNRLVTLNLTPAHADRIVPSPSRWGLEGANERERCGSAARSAR